MHLVTLVSPTPHLSSAVGTSGPPGSSGLWPSVLHPAMQDLHGISCRLGLSHPHGLLTWCPRKQAGPPGQLGGAALQALWSLCGTHRGRVQAVPQGLPACSPGHLCVNKAAWPRAGPCCPPQWAPCPLPETPHPPGGGGGEPAWPCALTPKPASAAGIPLC